MQVRRSLEKATLAENMIHPSINPEEFIRRSHFEKHGWISDKSRLYKQRQLITVILHIL